MHVRSDTQVHIQEGNLMLREVTQVSGTALSSGEKMIFFDSQFLIIFVLDARH